MRVSSFAGLVTGAAFAAAAGSGSAQGVNIEECDWINNLLAVVEPWEENSRTFYRGQVRVAFADSVEPACCWAHLLILMPDPEDEMGLRKCVAVNQSRGMGFSGLEFSQIQASYDPARGLTLTFPYALYNPETGASGPWQTGEVLINLSTGAVTAP